MTLNFHTVAYDTRKNHLIILDQTKLPELESYLHLKSVENVVQAIKRLQVRGAPLIGVAAAYGVVMAAHQGDRQRINKAIRMLASARPTAVNLTWALDRMRTRMRAGDVLYRSLLNEARLIDEEDKETCLAIGRFGSKLIKQKAKIMTHCNAGALATTGIGTALGVIYTARQQKKYIEVYACETRPLLQGSRLTAWELTRSRIRTHVICDNMAANFMPEMSMVIIGADRIAANGDTANKIGSKGLAIIAGAFGVPFYIAAPCSSFDPKSKSGSSIPIEHRDDCEMTFFNHKRIAARQSVVHNPAFDVTPHHLITAFITERGIIKPPFRRNIYNVLKNAS